MSKNKIKKDNKSETAEQNNETDVIGPNDYITLKQIGSIIAQSFHEGPLPDPDTFKRYNEGVSDAAERILKMTETTLEHEIKKESRILDNEYKKVRIGQSFAFFSFIIGVLGAVICALTGHETVGSILGGATICSVVSSFLSFTRRKDSTKTPPAQISADLEKKNTGKKKK